MLDEQGGRTEFRPHRRVVDLAPHFIVVVAPDGTITYANKASVALLGYEPEELLGRNGLDLLDPEDRASASGRWARWPRAAAPPCRR